MVGKSKMGIPAGDATEDQPRRLPAAGTDRAQVVNAPEGNLLFTCAATLPAGFFWERVLWIIHMGFPSKKVKNMRPSVD